MNLPKALVLTVAATTFCLMTSPAFAVQETTPQNMTCQEFMDMNPKSMTPVAFWVVNRNTDFSGGDYVDWHEVETVSVPKMLQQCHKNPAAKLGDLNSFIKKKASPRRSRGKVNLVTRRYAAGPVTLIAIAFARQRMANLAHCATRSNATAIVCRTPCSPWRVSRRLGLMLALELAGVDIVLLHFAPQGGAANIQQLRHLLHPPAGHPGSVNDGLFFDGAKGQAGRQQR